LSFNAVGNQAHFERQTSLQKIALMFLLKSVRKEKEAEVKKLYSHFAGDIINLLT
jgi:hypothetical protein